MNGRRWATAAVPHLRRKLPLEMRRLFARTAAYGFRCELTLSATTRRSSVAREFPQRYYEGLFVICPLELKREFDQLDLTEGERNECVWNSPSGKAYGRSERAVHGLRTEGEELED